MSQPVKHLSGLEHAIQTMPFDQFGRYHMLREAVDACRPLIGTTTLKILDVGGYYLNAEDQHVLPILPFFPNDNVTVVDTVECNLPHYERGDGTKLAYADGSFDFVVTADTLEHIPQAGREAFWHELLRVAKHGVILLAPFASPQVENAEELLNSFIKTYLQSEHVMLNEHEQYGLPHVEQWLKWLEQAGYQAKAYPTGYVHAWIAMMMLKHLLLRLTPGAEAQYRLDRYYNEHFFPTERRNPAYRYLIFVEKTAGLADAVDAVIAPTIYPEREDVSDWASMMTPIINTVTQAQLASIQHELIRPSQMHADNLSKQIDILQQQISLLNRTQADANLAYQQLQQAYQQLATQSQEATQQLQQQQRALTEQLQWKQQQHSALTHELEAIKRGRIMRLLTFLAGRK